MDDAVVHTSPWFTYVIRTKRRYCQPDALVTKDECITIVEIKLTHCEASYWQLRHLYQPVVRHVFPEYETRLVAIVKNFDPSVPFPEDLWCYSSIEDCLADPDTTRFAVVRMKL